MARGLAVVTLPADPDSELVLDGVSGLNVHDGRSLVAAIRRLGSDPFLREGLGEAALDRVETAHLPDVVGASLERRLRDLAGRASDPDD
jgi:glycosyltransferase involved in cell wall biosynthesis